MDTNHISLKYLWRFVNWARFSWFYRGKLWFATLLRNISTWFFCALREFHAAVVLRFGWNLDQSFILWLSKNLHRIFWKFRFLPKWPPFWFLPKWGKIGPFSVYKLYCRSPIFVIPSSTQTLITLAVVWIFWFCKKHCILESQGYLISLTWFWGKKKCRTTPPRLNPPIKLINWIN